jgi:divalent metal cation (Fe/Co/Zn/Cd) transporter
VAFLGVFSGHLWNNVYLDGVASIAIGIILAGVALLLAYESKGLLIGEGANASTVADIKAITEADVAVTEVLRVLTLHFGPEEILLNLEIRFNSELSTENLAIAIERIERQIRDRHSDIQNIFIEAKSIAASRQIATTISAKDED